MITYLALCSSTFIYGQYTTAIGFRVGETTGLTAKSFRSNSTAVEGIIGIWNRGFSVTGLYEKYAPAFGNEQLNWYYGGGAHLAFVTSKRSYRWYDYGQRRFYYDDGGVGIGIDGAIGLEYKILRAPIAFSLDFKPFVEFNTSGGAWVSLDPGVGMKIAF
jgi:hypothetical protein